MSGTQFAIVVPARNCEMWCIQNLRSIAEQTYPHFTLYYIDDASTDATYEMALLWSEMPGLQGKTKIVQNKERQGSLANLYSTIHKIPPNEVVVVVDGDDWLYHDKVLENLSKVYSDPAVWVTFGGMISEPEEALIHTAPVDIPELVIQKNGFRAFGFHFHALRTFYASLFQRIQKKDLMWQESFYPVSGDCAFMFPIIEMAGKHHFKRIDETQYVYNCLNPHNDFRASKELQKQMTAHIRAQKPYQPLDTL